MATAINNRRAEPATKEDLERLRSAVLTEVRLAFGVLMALTMIILGIVATKLL